MGYNPLFAIVPFYIYFITHKETKRPSDFRLELQTCDYSLWPRYTLIAKFNDDKPFKYEVRAQHTIWE